MKFQDAQAVIASIVNNQYFTMTYEFTKHTDGELIAKCSCFTIGDVNDPAEHGYGTDDHPDWEGVIKELEEYMHGKGKAPAVNTEEAPE